MNKEVRLTESPITASRPAGAGATGTFGPLARADLVMHDIELPGLDALAAYRRPSP